MHAVLVCGAIAYAVVAVLYGRLVVREQIVERFGPLLEDLPWERLALAGFVVVLCAAIWPIAIAWDVVEHRRRALAEKELLHDVARRRATPGSSCDAVTCDDTRNVTRHVTSHVTASAPLLSRPPAPDDGRRCRPPATVADDVAEDLGDVAPAGATPRGVSDASFLEERQLEGAAE